MISNQRFLHSALWFGIFTQTKFVQSSLFAPWRPRTLHFRLDRRWWCIDWSAAQNVRMAPFIKPRNLEMSETVSYQSIELLVSSAMKTSTAYFQTGRPLCAVSLAPSSFPNQLFFRPFLFSFVSTVFFILLGALRWSFEPTGPSTSLTVDVSAVQMHCPSSAVLYLQRSNWKYSMVLFISTISDSIVRQSSQTICWFNTSRTLSTLPKGFSASYALLSCVNFPSQ